MKTSRVYGLLGLAKKAGKVESGEFSTENAIKAGTACLVLISTAASDNTKKKFTDMCNFRQIPLRSYGKPEELAGAIGQEYRVTAAITDAGFAEALLKKIDEEQA